MLLSWGLVWRLERHHWFHQVFSCFCARRWEAEKKDEEESRWLHDSVWMMLSSWEEVLNDVRRDGKWRHRSECPLILWIPKSISRICSTLSSRTSSWVPWTSFSVSVDVLSRRFESSFDVLDLNALDRLWILQITQHGTGSQTQSRQWWMLLCFFLLSNQRSLLFIIIVMSNSWTRRSKQCPNLRHDASLVSSSWSFDLFARHVLLLRFHANALCDLHGE